MAKRKAFMLAAGVFFSSMALAQEMAPASLQLVFYAMAVLALLWLASLAWVSLRVLSSSNKTKWKALWIIATIVLGVFGAVFFFILGEKKRIPGKKETQKQNSKQASRQPGVPEEVDLYSKADIQPMAGFKPSLSDAPRGQAVEGHKKMPAAFSAKPSQESGLFEYGKNPGFVKPKTKDLFEQFKKEIARPEPIQPEPEPEPVFEKQEQPVEETPALDSDKTLGKTGEIALSPGEKTEVEELARIIEPEKNEHPKEEILNIILEKGYSINVARAVLKELFKN
ncbi:MAG: hypothetical protein HY392_05180 [Candidatus Diapherotrites archaeon]|nr:hypothetical protein [Candidatus Diapherotrites archaeon]